MAPEDLHSLGFDPTYSVKPGPEGPAAEPCEVILGLASAQKKKGIIFGFSVGGGGAGK